MKSERIKELKLCLRLSNKAYDSVSGNLEKAAGAFEVVKALKKRLNKLIK